MQAERWGAELLTEDVEHVDLQQRPFIVRSTDVEVSASYHLCPAKDLNDPCAPCSLLHHVQRGDHQVMVSALYIIC